MARIQPLSSFSPEDLMLEPYYQVRFLVLGAEQNSQPAESTADN